MDDSTRQLSRLHRRTMRPQTACPTSERLATLAQGSAWPWQRRSLASHLGECPHCAAEFRSVLSMRDGLHDALDAPRSHAGHGWVAWITGFGTAGACAALLAAILLLPQGTDLGAPGGAESDVLFTSDFAPGASTPAEDTLFRGDFDDQRPETLFQSDFGV